MGQIRLTSRERIQALQRLGYSEREAGFLCMAALHGGYFLRRQYGQFLGKALGGTAAALIEKAVYLGHVQSTSAGHTQIYHLCARPFYAALGQEDNRNRRLRSVAAMRCKLIGLDFVLAHPGHEFLATEQEKVDYFTGIVGLARDLLPAKRYVSQGRSTERYFVEKYPMFLSAVAREAAPPSVSFCYIDAGAQSVCGFETFLGQYATLMSNLSDFRVIYVGAQDAHIPAAAAFFERWRQALHHEGLAPTASLVARLLEHFEARLLYEKEDWSAFDRGRLIQFRNERSHFSGDRYESLYRRWKASGVGAVESFLKPGLVQRPRPQATFSTYKVDQTYDFFGRFPNA